MAGTETGVTRLASKALSFKLWIAAQNWYDVYVPSDRICRLSRKIRALDKRSISIIQKYASKKPMHSAKPDAGPWSRHRVSLVRAMEPLILMELCNLLSKTGSDHFNLNNDLRTCSRMFCDLILTTPYNRVKIEELSAVVAEAVSDPLDHAQLEILKEILDQIQMQLLK